MCRVKEAVRGGTAHSVHFSVMAVVVVRWFHVESVLQQLTGGDQALQSFVFVANNRRFGVCLL